MSVRYKIDNLLHYITRYGATFILCTLQDLENPIAWLCLVHSNLLQMATYYGVFTVVPVFKLHRPTKWRNDIFTTQNEANVKLLGYLLVR